ncbi:hypothetical protein BDY24DRAFT_380101 [Mrakia frigida]|uniref:uncharacterized protein n=1 Tax=Mrakia frigida TaxID=29902 RepID=UPI003FCBF6A7
MLFLSSFFIYSLFLLAGSLFTQAMPQPQIGGGLVKRSGDGMRSLESRHALLARQTRQDYPVACQSICDFSVVYSAPSCESGLTAAECSLFPFRFGFFASDPSTPSRTPSPSFLLVSDFPKASVILTISPNSKLVNSALNEKTLPMFGHLEPMSSIRLRNSWLPTRRDVRPRRLPLRRAPCPLLPLRPCLPMLSK